ncbi:MAG: hypothetical protein V4590_14725 [Bacteroidota bacterium]
MKQSTVIACIVFILASCTSSRDTEAQKTLLTYKNFVDSIYAQNEVWKMYPDTDFVETPTDPTNPAITRIDTVVTPADKKKAIVLHPFFGKGTLEAYGHLKVEVEAFASKMDDGMKKEYETSRQKFESMMQ